MVAWGSVLQGAKDIGSKVLPALKKGGTALSKLGNFVGDFGSVAGSAASAFLSYKEQLALQQQNQQWQEYMSNTAHQREVNDLQAAGLNPVLSANSGASYGSVGTGTASVPDFGSNINTAKAVGSQIELAKAQAWREGKTASLLGEQARNEAERYGNIVAEREKTLQDIINAKRITDAQIANISSNTAKTWAEASHIYYGLPFDKLGSDFWSSGYGKSLYFIDRTSNSAQGVGDGITSFVPKFGKVQFGSNYRYSDSSRHHYDTYTGKNSHYHEHINN